MNLLPAVLRPALIIVALARRAAFLRAALGGLLFLAGVGLAPAASAPPTSPVDRSMRGGGPIVPGSSMTRGRSGVMAPLPAGGGRGGAVAVGHIFAPTPGWMIKTFNGNGIKGELAIPGDSLPRFGFIPVRVTTTNSTSRDLRLETTFTLSVQSTSSGYPNVTEVVVPVSAPASRELERWIFVPTPDGGLVSGYGNFGSGLSARVRGPGLEAPTLFFNANSNQTGMMPWAVSSSLENDVRARLGALVADPKTRPPSRAQRNMARGRGALPPGAPVPLLYGPANLAPIDLTQSLTDWRIWSPFVRVILREDEYAVLLPANRTALRRWVAMGGTLYLFPENPRETAEEAVGAGRIVSLPRPIADTTDDARGLFTSAAVFGVTPVVPNFGDLMVRNTGINKLVPPARRVGDWLVYFFVAFAIVIGPVNLFAIAPVRRRHWLFFSVPAISLVAAAILGGAIYLQDGVGGEGARSTLVALLPGESEAAVFQDQVTRTGLLFSSKFPLAEDTILAPVVTDGESSPFGRSLRYVRQDGEARGDWFRGRTRQAQQLRRLVPTRARVELVGRSPDGAPIVQSSFGTVLSNVVSVDREGGVWRADQVPPGSRVTLQREADPARYNRESSLFAESGSTAFRQLVLGATRTGAADRFIAHAGASELGPIETIEGINWRASPVMITGVLAGAPTGAAP